MEIFTLPPKFTHWHSTTVWFFIFVGFFIFVIQKLKGTLEFQAKGSRKGSRPGYHQSHLHICKAEQHFLKHLWELDKPISKERRIGSLNLAKDPWNLECYVPCRTWVTRSLPWSVGPQGTQLLTC